MEIFILYKFYIFFIFNLILKKQKQKPVPPNHSCSPRLREWRAHPVSQTAWGCRLGSGTRARRSFSMSGGQQPLSFHNRISTWGANSLNISTLTLEAISVKMSSFIEILDNAFQYHTKLCMCIKRDRSDYTFFFLS